MNTERVRNGVCVCVISQICWSRDLIKWNGNRSYVINRQIWTQHIIAGRTRRWRKIWQAKNNTIRSTVIWLVSHTIKSSKRGNRLASIEPSASISVSSCNRFRKICTLSLTSTSKCKDLPVNLSTDIQCDKSSILLFQIDRCSEGFFVSISYSIHYMWNG